MKTIIYAILFLLAIATPAWALEGGLGYTGMDRTDTVVLNLNHEAGAWNFNAEGRYGETDDVIITNQGYFNAIYEHELSARCSISGGNKTGFNTIRNINVENFLGAGPKCYLYQNDTTKLTFSVWYLNQYADYSDKDSELFHRMSYRPKLSYRKGTHKVNLIFYYQPSLNGYDYFTIAEASWSVKISDTQAVGFRFYDEYRSEADKKHETLRYFNWSYRPK